jgi:hypothetical protein
MTELQWPRKRENHITNTNGRDRRRKQKSWRLMEKKETKSDVKRQNVPFEEYIRHTLELCPPNPPPKKVPN